MSCGSATLFDLADFDVEVPTPDLTTYDLILVNTSAGKDSQVALDLVVRLAREAGVADRLVAVHADLGRVEWEGTADLAARQAAAYGVPFVVVKKAGYADLLDRIEQHGKWPGPETRFCTSEFKTAQVRSMMTQLVRLHPERGVIGRDGTLKSGRQLRILNVQGIRAQESSKRAGRNPLEYEAAASNTLRHVDRWYPIFRYTVEDVWAAIRASGVEHHRAYDLGFPRLSCVFCIFAPRDVLVAAARENPELADEYVAVEVRIGHRFKDDLTMADVVADARSDRVVELRSADWGD